MSLSERHDLTPAFLLHRRDYSNSSLLVECFNETHGRFPAIVKGVKGRGKSASALLQPFIPLQISWAGRGDIKTLTQYEQAGRLLNLQGKSLYCGFYINEMLMRLLHRNDPHEQLFHCYAATLDALAAKGADEPTLRYFELDMLNQLGYGIVLDMDIESGAPIDPEDCYQYIPERGLVISSVGDKHAFSGRTLISLRQRTISTSQELREARSLLRCVLGFYLGDKPLKSRELFHLAYRK